MKSCRYSSLVLLLALTQFAGCASTGTSIGRDVSTREWLLSGAALAGYAGDTVLPGQDEIMFMDDSMKRLVEQAVAGQATARGKVRAMLDAIIKPSGLGLEYDPSASFTAREAFVERRANCMSFTLMVVAMLRHVGVETSFNVVEVPLLGDMRDESTLVFYKHINAIVQFPFDAGRAVVDLDLDAYDVNYEQRVITDAAAVAQYYNNRAMEFLQQGNTRAAFPYLVKALTIEPEQSYFWSNLGALYQRSGNLQAAREAFEVALEENSNDLVAMSNAARLYAFLGETKRAEVLTRRVEHFRAHNPYYRYLLAVTAFRVSDYETARRELTEAIRLHKQEHLFHFLLGAVYEKLGMHEAALQSVNTALTLTTDEKQLARYKGKMGRLFSSAQM